MTAAPSAKTSWREASSESPCELPAVLGGGGAASAAKKGADPRHDLARAERLGDVIVRAYLETDQGVRLLGTRGKHQHIYVGGLADAPERLESVDPWQPHIENDEVGYPAIERVKSLLAGYRLLDIEAVAVEVVREQLPDVCLVVDDEDAPCAHVVHPIDR